jgi:hypothetical protein
MVTAGAYGCRTNRLSDRRLAITFSRISSGSIDMPPSGVTRRDFRLLRAAMNARSLACSRPDLLSRQTNSIHRHNKLMSLSTAVETWNAFSLMGGNVVAFPPAHHSASANDIWVLLPSATGADMPSDKTQSAPVIRSASTTWGLTGRIK